MLTIPFDDASMEATAIKSIDTKGAEAEEGPTIIKIRQEEETSYLFQSTGSPTLH